MLLALCAATSAFAQTAPTSRNLLANPSLEDRAEKDAPPHWKAVTVWGAPATFVIDVKEKHGGQQSFRIASEQSTQSFVRSEPIEVAPGETIRASAWVKVKDIVVKDADAGVVLTAEMLNGDEHEEQFARFAKLTDTKRGAWQRIEGSIKVPPLAATLRLRLAFFDCSGMAWFDDATLQADAPLAARLDLRSEQITPEMGGVPVRIINRTRRHETVRLHAKLGERAADLDVALTGESAQSVTVPLPIENRGDLSVEMALYERGADRPLFAEKRDVRIPPPLALDPITPTHWVLEDGEPRMAGTAMLAVTHAQREQSKLEFEIIDQRGHAQPRINVEQALKDGDNRFTLPPMKIPAGSYKVIARLTHKGQSIAQAEQRWSVLDRREKVTIGDNGFLRVGDQPIFPLGVFNGSGRMKELGEAGFTIAHTYNSVEGEVGGRLDHVEAQGYLDAAQAAGMKALMLIPRRPLFAGDMETVRQRVRMFRNHPALLAWDEEEGIARGDMTPQRLAELRKLIAEEDPSHPLMVGDSRDVITNVTDRANFFPADSMDLGMWWWYPIPPLGEKGGALGGDEITAGAELVPPAFLTLSKLKQPLWVGLQSYKKPQSYGRFPTPAEYRAQAYLAIIHGAKGLMWYGGSVEGGIFLEPGEGKWDEVKRLVGELRQMAPTCASASQPAPALSPAGAPVSVALKRGTSGRVLIAVNRADTPLKKVVFSGIDSQGDCAVVEESRSVSITAGQFSDGFGPYAAHIYRIP